MPIMSAKIKDMEINNERVRLAFNIVGSQDIKANGEKPPIIFLHGMTSTKESWEDVIRPIAAATGRKAYAFDARNHGDSGWGDHLDYEIMRDDLLTFMDSILCQTAVLVGHSMGGKTAMNLATYKPERVEKLISEDMSPKQVQPHLREQGGKKYLRLLRTAINSIPSDLEDIQEAKRFLYNFLHKNTPQDHRSFRKEEDTISSYPLFKDEDGNFKWKANLKVIDESFLDSPKHSVTGSYSGPTLILYGTKSPYKVSADRDYIKHVFPQAQLRAIEGASHQIHDEFPDIFVKEVVEFINES